MEKFGKIKGLTMYYESDAGLLQMGLMLRFVNGDVSFDIEDKIDYELNVLRENPDRTPDYKRSFADLTYWKYKFLASPENKYRDLDKAYSYLKKAYKAGSPDAMAQYAYYYYTGSGITNTVDKQKAKKLFDKAMKEDNLFVEFLIAEALLSEEDDDPKILRAAAAYYEKAIEKKVLECRPKLAGIYLQLKENLDRAIELFKASGNKYGAQALKAELELCKQEAARKTKI